MNLDRPPYIHIAGSVCRMVLHLILLTLMVGVAAAQIGPVFTNLSRADGLSGNRIIDVVQDHKGFIWIGTDSGLNSFDRKNNKINTWRANPNNPNSLSHNNIFDIISDEQGNLWIGTLGGGLNYLDVESGVITAIQSNTSSVNNQDLFIYDLEFLNSNTLMIGTSGSGLLSYDIQSKKLSSYQLQSCMMLSIFI